jgi:hypothetical protein
MHHAPQGSWARLTVRLVSPTCPEFVGPHWLALLYHCTIFIVICKGVSVVFLWRFFGIVVSRYSVRVYVERGCPADPKSLWGKGLRRFANNPAILGLDSRFAVDVRFRIALIVPNFRRTPTITAARTIHTVHDTIEVHTVPLCDLVSFGSVVGFNDHMMWTNVKTTRVILRVMEKSHDDNS